METPVVTGSVALPDGRVATIHHCRAPLPPEHGMALAWFLEGAFGAEDKPDVFVTAAAKGLLEATSRNDFAWAVVDGAVVSTAWTMSPANEPRLATMGEVYTDPAFRGRGLAPAVCAALLDRFDAAGGRQLFLGTGNPSAARIYASLGFVPYPAGLMRRDRPTSESGPGSESGDPWAFDAEWFAPSSVAIRPVEWGDTPRLVALYGAPNPWLSAAWMQGLYSASHVTHNRCNSLMKHTWQATRPGVWPGMVNTQGALVGSGPMQPWGNETAVVGADIDLFVHPAFQSDAGDLLDAMLAEARLRGWRWLNAELGVEDQAKRDLLAIAGFREVARLAAALEIRGDRQDVCVLRLEL